MCLVILCELLEDNNHHGHVVTADAAASSVFCQAMVAHTLRDVPYALTFNKPLSDKVDSLQAKHKHCLKTLKPICAPSSCFLEWQTGYSLIIIQHADSTAACTMHDQLPWQYWRDPAQRSINTENHFVPQRHAAYQHPCACMHAYHMTKAIPAGC